METVIVYIWKWNAKKGLASEKMMPILESGIRSVVKGGGID